MLYRRTAPERSRKRTKKSPFRWSLTLSPLAKRFDDELIDLLLKFRWWDKSIAEINHLIPLITCSDLDKVKSEVKRRLQ